MIVLTSFSPPTEGVRFKEENTVANIDGNSIGNGSLFIAESHLSWLGEGGQGFSLEYPAISLHALSRDPNTFPSPCLYLMIDAKLIEQEDKVSNSSDSDEDENPVCEVRFIPSNSDVLGEMFQSMNECQALHPDQEDVDSDSGGDGDNFYQGEDGFENLTPEGRATLQHLESVIRIGDSRSPPTRPNENHVNGEEIMDTEQFEDADMDQR
ncbi:methylosome subunit pICln-like [Gigantopelta aegis]|uniref:methylosome subunit pICln-like n=1 Tax=Gigantopelta aegis TaxID=1735272 RepID=UPI001B88DD2C|nr:methylosome subunit pICln-like [Gigantopelta aegis]